jgi:hypothetical protein
MIFRLLEKKRKAERAELEKKLQYLNTKFQASFFNPDKVKFIFFISF